MSKSLPDSSLDRRDWSGDLPTIPATREVFWPTITLGALSILVGLYLIITPQPAPRSALPGAATPVSTTEPLASPAPGVSPTNDGVTVFRCSFVDSSGTSFAAGVEEFAAAVAELSDGKVRIEPLPNGLVDGRKLGERQLIEALREGRLEMAVCTTSPLTNFDHRLDLFDLPFLFENEDHAIRVLDGSVGRELLGVLEDKGMVGLDYFPVGFRVVSSSVPMPDFDSFAGKRIRIMESVIFNRYAKAVHADPVPSPVDRIYMMGKEGYIDAADRTYPTYWDFQLYDIHRFITETRHAFSVKMLLINAELYTQLEPELREILVEAAKRASLKQRPLQREADLQTKQMAIEEGIQIFRLSPQDRKRFSEAAEDLFDQYRREEAPELLEAALRARN